MNIGIIGIGRIASAITEGLMNTQNDDIEIYISSRNETLSKQLAEKYAHVHRTEDNQSVLDKADIIILAVSPSVAVSVLSELSFKHNHTIISLVSTLKFADLSMHVQPALHVCRAIPLPTVVNHNCPIPLFKPTREVTDLFDRLGHTFVVEEEKQLHALWTLTGLITPFYDLLGTLSDWAIAHGVDGETATKYTADMFHSLSDLHRMHGRIDFAALAKHAETPKGMNEQAGREIRTQHARDIYAAAADNLLKRFDD